MYSGRIPSASRAQSLMFNASSSALFVYAPSRFEADRKRGCISRVFDQSKASLVMVLLQPDPFLNELTSMFERSTEKGSVWVTLKRSSLKSKIKRNKMATAGEPIEYRCLIRATDGKKTISTSVGAKDHQRFQSSYATILKAHMTSLKKKERKDKKKTLDAADNKKDTGSKKPKRV